MYYDGIVEPNSHSHMHTNKQTVFGIIDGYTQEQKHNLYLELGDSMKNADEKVRKEMQDLRKYLKRSLAHKILEIQF